jgi:hypothetical protein
MSNTHVESGMRMPLAASALLGTLAENWWLLLLRDRPIPSRRGTIDSCCHYALECSSATHFVPAFMGSFTAS